MNGDDNIDTWSLERLADEPIYCAVPTPSNPDDIICYGSDEELDDTAKVAKRLRYEQQGQRYLRGQPLRLFSTTLRGPFDKASGWRNPWVPQTANKIQLKKKTSNGAPAIKKSFLRQLKFQAAAKNATPGTEDSMQCQLPSPESSRGVETYHEYLDGDKHGRIRAWARDISPEPLERDSFWAPDKFPNDSNDDTTRRRHAANDWLRKKTTKSDRPNDTQGTEAASTRTPFRARNLLTNTNSVSAPVPAVQCTEQKASQKVPNRSFELTTPSSTADKRSNPTNMQPASPSIHDDAQSASKVDNIDENTASVTSSAPSTTPRKPPTDDSKSTAAMQKSLMISSGVSKVQEQEQGDETNGSPLQSDQSELVRGEEQDCGGNPYEDGGFESLHDQSLHYRTRLAKQETRVEHPGSRVGDSPPQITQHTSLEMQEMQEMQGMQDCSNGDNESSRPTEEDGPVPAKASDRSNTPPLAADGSLSKDTMVESGCNGGTAAKLDPTRKYSEGGSTTSFESSKADSVSSLAGAVPDTVQGNELSSHTSNPENLEHTSNREISTGTCSPSKRNHTSTENCMSQSPQPPLKKLRFEQSGESQADKGHEARHTEEHRMGLEAAVGEFSTLVGGSKDDTVVEDPMDIDGHSVVKPAKSPSPTPHADSGTCGTHPMSKVPCAGNGSTGNANDEASEDGSGAPLSRLDWRTVNSKQLEPSKPIYNYMSNPISLGFEEAPQDIKENIPAAQLALDQSSIHQSPWAPDCLASNEVNIKNEPIDDDEIHLPSSTNLHYSIPSKDQPQHVIRASQQSPWTQQTPLLSMGAVKEYRFRISDIESVSERIKTMQNEEQGLGEQANVTTMDQASALPIPAAENFPERNTEVNKPQSPDLQRQTPRVVEAPEPFTPAPAPKARTASTPEPEISIKSFAKFNTPSPVRRRTNPVKPRGRSTGGRRSGILVSTPSNPWGSAAKSNNSSSRRVSFAPLPGHDGGDDEHALPTFSILAGGGGGTGVGARAASPPPETTVEAGDEDVNDTFHKHFDAVKQRRQQQTTDSTGGGNSAPPPKFRMQPRLLPSASQQQPASPDIGAMAAAFQEADALVQRDIGATTRKNDHNNTTTTTEPPVTEEEDRNTYTTLEDVPVPETEAEAEAANAAPQSPWRSESQTQQVVDDDDAVAAVLGNLDQFLDAWDVDAAMRQANFDDDDESAAAAPEQRRRINVWD